MVKDFVFKVKVDTAAGQKELEKTITTLNGFDDRIKQLNEQIKSTDFGSVQFKELNQELAITTAAKSIMIEEGQRLATTLGTETDALMSNTQATTDNTQATDLNAAALQRVENETKQTAGGFQKYQLQIRKARTAFQEAFASGDEKAMKKYRNEIDDLEDAYEIATLKSMKFGDAMASLPGVTGLVGQSIQGLEKGFKVLAANPLVATFTLLAGLATALFGAFSKTEKGGKSLAKVGEFMERVFNGIVAVLEPLFNWFSELITAFTESDTAMKILGGTVGGVAATLKGLWLLVKGVVLTLVDLWTTVYEVGKALGGLGDAIGKFFSGDFKGAAADAKKVFNDIGNLGSKFIDDVSKRAKDSVKEVADTYTSASQSFTQGFGKALKKDTENATKALEELKKQVEDYVNGAEKVKKESRENELKAEQDLYTELKNKAKGNADLLTQIEEAYRIRKGAINDKWNELDAKKLEESLKQNLDNLNKYLDQETKDIERKRNNRNNKEKSDLKQKFLDGLITQEEYEAASLQQNIEFAENQQKEDNKLRKEKEASLILSRAFGLVSLKQYQDETIKLNNEYDQKDIENAQSVTNAKQDAAAKALEYKKALANAEVSVTEAQAEAELAVKMGYFDAISTITSIITSLAGENKEVAKAAVLIEQGVAVGRILTQSSADISKIIGANAANSALFPALAPKFAALAAKQTAAVKISAGIGIASAIAGAIKGIADINKAGGGGNEQPQKLAEGGMVFGSGTSTSDSVPAFLSNGESVINAKSTAAFGPLLSTINELGGGRSFDITQLGSVSSLDSSPMESAPIKTYVVSSEMTNMQMFQRTQKERSTL